jgi:hypothetical protein
MSDFSLKQVGAYQGMSSQVTLKACLGYEAGEGTLAKLVVPFSILKLNKAPSG